MGTSKNNLRIEVRADRRFPIPMPRSVIEHRHGEKAGGTSRSGDNRRWAELPKRAALVRGKTFPEEGENRSWAGGAVAEERIFEVI
jgi:hypothetical protein